MIANGYGVLFERPKYSKVIIDSGKDFTVL